MALTAYPTPEHHPQKTLFVVVPSKTYHFHLVSDATGETIKSIARACLVQFEGVNPVEHLWPLIRNRRQLAEVIEGIHAEPGMVFYTLVNDNLRTQLEDACRQVDVPCHSVLDPMIVALGHYLGSPGGRRQPGRQHALDQKYFDRIEAMDFAMAHDDGQGRERLMSADVVLVGVSRTSKTPTSIYLANNGVRAANVPLVPGQTPPDILDALPSGTPDNPTNPGPLVVGLTTDPARLVQIRRNRLRLLNQTEETDYVDPDLVKQEVVAAQRYFLSKGWPVIDVTRRSIEETAAAIVQLLTRRRESLAYATLLKNFPTDNEYR